MKVTNAREKGLVAVCDLVFGNVYESTDAFYGGAYWMCVRNYEGRVQVANLSNGQLRRPCGVTMFNELDVEVIIHG